MKKLTLDLDQLTVESFATDAARRAAGTVRGNAAESEYLTDCTACTGIVQCPSGISCDSEPSCHGSCDGSCTTSTDVGQDTCGLTC
jgi:hypothetical protein